MWDHDLDGPALEFAGANEPRIRSLAGPGTGKTFALMRRIHRLLEQGVPPRRILVVTLTRTAASDLVGELQKLGVANSKDVRACTLHSLCFQILSQEDVLALTHRIPRILSKFESDLLLKDLPDALGTFTEKKKLLRSYLSAWASVEGDPLGTPAPGLPKEFLQEFLSYFRWHRCMLIGELVPIARAYLSQNPYAPALNWFDHILVDEYQDLNKADQHIVDLLAASALEQERGQLAVVGDDDQAIYVMLRNAHPSGIVEFPSNRTVRFSECKRCPSRIVSMAQCLIDNNPGRDHDPLVSDAGNDMGEIHNVVFSTMNEEAEALARFIDKRISTRRVEPGEVLVLANWRQIAYGIRDILAGRGHRVHSYFQEQVLDNQRAKEALTLMTLLAKPDDRVALRSWLALRCKGEGRAAYRRMYEVAYAEGIDAPQLLAALESGSRKIAHTATAVAAWRQLKRELVSLKGKTGNPSELLDLLVPADVPDLTLLREAGLRALEFLENSDDLAGFCDGLRKQIRMPEVPLEADFIRVMSLHKSKGLKAKLVVIAGLVQGLIPRNPDPGTDGAEVDEHFREQRRVFYVGIIRCRETLVLSKFERSALRDAKRAGIALGAWSGRGTKRTVASSFMDELGPELPSAVSGFEWVYD